jgi:hypothetical protein
MNQIPACAMVVLLGLASHAVAAEQAERQQSAPFPGHTAIPEKFGAPIRVRIDESENMRPPEVPMPLPAPDRRIDPIPAAAKE